MSDFLNKYGIKPRSKFLDKYGIGDSVSAQPKESPNAQAGVEAYNSDLERYGIDPEEAKGNPLDMAESAARGFGQNIVPFAHHLLPRTKVQDENPVSSDVGAVAGFGGQMWLTSGVGKLLGMAAEAGYAPETIARLGKFFELGGDALTKAEVLNPQAVKLGKDAIMNAPSLAEKVARAKDYGRFGLKMGALAGAQGATDAALGGKDAGEIAKQGGLSAVTGGILAPAIAGAANNLPEIASSLIAKGSKMLDETDMMRVKLLKLPPALLSKMIGDGSAQTLGKNLREYTKGFHGLTAGDSLFGLSKGISTQAEEKLARLGPALDTEMSRLDELPQAKRFMEAKPLQAKVRGAISGESDSDILTKELGPLVNKQQQQIDEGFLSRAHPDATPDELDAFIRLSPEEQNVLMRSGKNPHFTMETTVPGDESTYVSQQVPTGRKFMGGTPETKEVISGKQRSGATREKITPDILMEEDRPKEQMYQLQPWWDKGEGAPITKQDFNEIRDSEMLKGGLKKGPLPMRAGKLLPLSEQTEEGITQGIENQIGKRITPDPEELTVLKSPGERRMTVYNSKEQLPQSNFYGGESGPEAVEYFSPKELWDTQKVYQGNTGYKPGVGITEDSANEDIIKRIRNAKLRSEFQKGLENIEVPPDEQNLNQLLGKAYPSSKEPTVAQNLFSEYGKAADISDLSLNATAKQVNQPAVAKLTKSIVSQNLAKSAAGGGGGLVGAATGVGIEASTKYGTGVMIKGRDLVSKMLMESPEKLGQYAAPLLNIAKNNPKALNAAITTYLNRPQFRQEIGLSEEGFIHNDTILSQDKKANMMVDGLSGTK